MSQSVEFDPMFQGVSISEVEIPLESYASAQEFINGFSDAIVQHNAMPRNFITLSEASKAFREALTAQILIDLSNNGSDAYDQVLNTFSSWLQMTPPGVSTLKTLQEYAASIAFAVERKDLAVKIIKRSKPGETTPTLWTIVDAIKKGMPGVLYQNLLINNLFSAIAQVEDQRTSGYINSYLK